MTKAEYFTVLYHCYIRCEPEENKCKDCIILKTYKKKYMETQKSANKFCECETLEEFKDMYIKFHLQDLALQDGVSYFNVETSNMDGTIIGEQYDHSIRMKSFYENNEKFFKEVNINELMDEVNERYQKDISKYIDSYGKERFEKDKIRFGKYYKGYKEKEE